MQPIALLVFLVLGLLPAANAQAALVSWDLMLGVLPSDPSIPVDQRFDLSGEPSYATISGGPLAINDFAVTPTVSFSRLNGFGATWAYEVEVKMISHERQAGWLELGSIHGVQDGSRRVYLAVATDEVGFVAVPSTDWINSQSISMDTTDDFHTYRVVKTESTVKLFIDSGESEGLSISHDSFFATSAESVLLLATSQVGIANFDVSRFETNTDEVALTSSVPGLSPVSIVLLVAALTVLMLMNRTRPRLHRLPFL